MNEIYPFNHEEFDTFIDACAVVIEDAQNGEHVNDVALQAAGYSREEFNRLCDQFRSECPDVVTDGTITPIAPLALPSPSPVVVTDNPVDTYISSLGVRSRRIMSGDLERIAGILKGPETGGTARDVPWHLLRFQHTNAIRTRLSENYAPATANRMLCALTGVLKACRRLGLISADDLANATDFRRVKGETLPAGRALTTGELVAVFNACADGTIAGKRDAALLAVLYAAGLRRSEVVGLDLSDYDPDNGALTVRHGKGNKQRVCYLKNGARDAMSQWLGVRGYDPGPLFLRILKADHMTIARLTDQAILHILTNRANRAGLKHCSPHDFRRTFISDLLDRGADIATVAKMAGHASVTTTARYDRRDEAAKEKASELLHVPVVLED